MAYEIDSSTHSIKQIEPALAEVAESPLLIAPLGFRPNAIFYGFETELSLIDQKLHNKKRLAMGSCSVLVTGTPGCGKTHLVRQYVWQSRADKKYPGGIFWVDAKTRENSYRSFWDIGQAAALLGASKPRNQDWDAATKYVETVRKWLESKQGWLLIFDGLAFDNEEQISDFLTFVPDRAGNCILITSVDRTLRGRQRLLNPTSVKVQPLSPQDGCSLLFTSLGIRKPSGTQIEKATELVKHYEGLPLAIHAAAHVLIARGRALETYTPGISSKRLAEPFLEIMQALRDNSHVEAVNFITLLSFFNHTIPVALINLGRRSLYDFGIEIRTTDRENSNKFELDNTIATLLRYGMVARVLQPYHLVQRSLSKEASFTTVADSSSVQTKTSNGSPVEVRSRRDSETTARTLQENIKPDNMSSDGSSQIKRPAYTTIENDSQTAPSRVDTRPDSSQGSSSAKSIRYNIDILRIHTVVQNVLRDELRLKDREKYYWWLIVAVKLFSFAYTVADTQIRNNPRQGLVRDYREFETQAAALRSHFPRPDKRPAVLEKVRHELRNIARKIRQEIKIRSPSHSIDSLSDRVQLSIFERSSSTSSDAPDTPSEISAGSWSPDDSGILESPVGLGFTLNLDPMESSDSWDDRGYETDNDSSAITTTRRSSRSDVEIDMPTSRDPAAARRSSVLQAIFQGRPLQSKKPKDLGEWKPMPVPPSVSGVDAMPLRTSSGSHSSDDRKPRPISAGSEAEAALAAVHRMSPPAARAGRIRSPSRTSALDGSESTKRPLGERDPNLQLSPLAAEFDPQKSSSQLTPRHHSRTSSSSPRIAQLAMANAASLSNKDLPAVPVEEGVAITRPTPTSVPQSIFYGSPPPSIAVNQQIRYIPSGYTSQPMSRGNSRESTHSLLSAPADSGAGLFGTSPPSASHRAQLSHSIDIIAANELEFGRMGEWSSNPITPMTPSLPGLNLPRAIDAVQFGQMDPVILDEARTRADAYARRGSYQQQHHNTRGGDAHR